MRARRSLVLGLAGIACVAASGVAHAAPTLSVVPVPTQGEARQGALGADGNLWFNQTGGDGLVVVTPAGAASRRGLPGGQGAQAVTAGPDGNIWFAGHPGSVGRVTPAGEVTTYAVPDAAADAEAYPRAITAGPDGNVWFTVRNSGRIVRVTPGGTMTGFSLPNAGSDPMGITTGADGNLWFAESAANRIGRITPAGAITEFALPAGHAAYAVAAGPDGNVWFTEPRADIIGRVTPAGAVTEYAIPTAGTAPVWISAGPDGNLWYVGESGRMGSVTTAGAITEYTLPVAATRPQSIVTGNDGTMWVGSMSTSLVKVDIHAAPFLTAATVSGTPRAGETLTCTPQVARWAGQDPALTYGWTRDGVGVSGATTATYTPGEGDTGAAVACSVEGRYPVLFPGVRNAATSAAVGIAAPVYGEFATAPKLTKGTALAFTVQASEPGRVVAYVENRAGKRIPLAPSSRLGRRVLATPMWASALPGGSKTTALPRTNVNLRFGKALPQGSTLHLVLQRPDNTLVALVAPRAVR